MGLFRREASDAPQTTEEVTLAPSSRRKSGPTPTRKQAEAARMERVHPKISKKERRAQERRADQRKRAEAYVKVEQSKERTLLRDWVDSRRHLAEFLLPLMVLFMAATFAVQAWFPALIPYVTMAVYLLFIATIVDIWLTWRGYKKLLADRLPNSSPKGQIFYMINRIIQIRRFRTPRPSIKPGEAI